MASAVNSFYRQDAKRAQSRKREIRNLGVPCALAVKATADPCHREVNNFSLTGKTVGV
jgi:hypothetical protein